MRTHAARIAAIVLLLSLWFPVSANEDLIVDAPIVGVTVYADRAEVEREVTLALPAGVATAVFAGLPASLDSASPRARVVAGPGRIGFVDIREQVAQPEAGPAYAEAKSEIQQFETAIARVEAKINVTDRLRQYLDGVGKVTVAGDARTADARIDAATLRDVYELLNTNLDALAIERADLDEARRVLGEKSKLAIKALADAAPGPEVRSRDVRVEVETAGAGEVTLRLAYVVPGASWEPAYRAAVDVDGNSVDLAFEGIVRQNTGESWDGVALRLSTATTRRGVVPPLLTSLVIARQSRSTPDRHSIESMDVISAGAGVEFGGAQGGFTRIAQGTTGVTGLASAGVERSAYNVTFDVPGRARIMSDGRRYRVALREERLEAAIVYRAAPSVDPRAFLTALVRSPADYPLLAGPMRVFAGEAYLGSFRVEETAPGSELTLPFGADNRIDVVRIPTYTQGPRGLAGKQQMLVTSHRTVVENLQPRPVTLLIEDRYPVAEDERVEVQLDRKTTAGYKNSEHRPGVLLWEFELEPGQRREILLGYSVRHPSDVTLPTVR